MTDSTHDFFDTLAKILLRCWIFGFLLLLVWFGIYMLASDVIYRLHGPMFGLSEHDLNVIHYCGMAFVEAGRDPVLFLSVAGDPAGAEETTQVTNAEHRLGKSRNRRWAHNGFLASLFRSRRSSSLS